MTREELFDIWAPADGIWSAWAKPVLFAYADQQLTTELTLPSVALGTMPPPADALVIVDLPGAAAVSAGVALASHGYRPVPLFNACPSPVIDDIPAVAIVDVRPIIAGLRICVGQIQQAHLRSEAPPAFMLDADRRTGSGAKPAAGLFDNRSISLPTDFPSANALLSRGIHRAILMQGSRTDPQPDLANTLAIWQRAGIQVESQANEKLIPITVRPPGFFRRLFRTTFATAGLTRNPLGGFGGTLPHHGTG